MAPEVYHGRQAEVLVGDTLDEIPEDNLYEEVNSDEEGTTIYSGDVMDITITDPELPVEVENTFGGQFIVEEPADLVEIDVTMRFRDISVFDEMHDVEEIDLDGEDWNHVEGARSPGNMKKRAFLFRVAAEREDGGQDIVHYLINEARFQQLGEVSLDAEGFAEISGTVLGLVENRAIQSNF